MEASERLIQKVLHYNVKMLGKHIRMLAELTQSSPVVPRRAGLDQFEGELVVMPRQRVQELVEQMESHLEMIRIGLEELASPGTHGWAKWQIVDGNQSIG